MLTCAAGIAQAMCFMDREAAYILNVSVRSVSRSVERGNLRAIYLTAPRRTRWFRLPDVKALLRRRISDSPWLTHEER